MNEFKVIVVMNEAMLKTLKDTNADYEKNLKIQKYLEDEAFFFKITKSNAYKILETVGVRQESLEDVYKKLTSPNMFYDLLNKGKINASDVNLIVKYDTYNSNDLFKKKNNGGI